jgi:hypothetical protein
MRRYLFLLPVIGGLMITGCGQGNYRGQGSPGQDNGGSYDSGGSPRQPSSTNGQSSGGMNDQSGGGSGGAGKP